MGPVIEPKMRNLQEIIGFLLKNQLYLNLYVLIVTFNNTITPQKCVENCSEDQLSILVHIIITSFFCNLDYNFENSVLFGQIPD